MLTGCATPQSPPTVSIDLEELSDSWQDEYEDEFDEDLVLVTFSIADGIELIEVRRVMGPIEERADAALGSSGLGYLDGWGSGGDTYDVFFYGEDRDAMWLLLEPIMRDAPIPLLRVELWPPGMDAVPTVIDLSDPVHAA